MYVPILTYKLQEFSSWNNHFWQIQQGQFLVPVKYLLYCTDMDQNKIRSTILNIELQHQMSTKYVVGIGAGNENGQA